jgi:hypothetical protein
MVASSQSGTVIQNVFKMGLDLERVSRTLQRPTTVSPVGSHPRTGWYKDDCTQVVNYIHKMKVNCKSLL